MNDETTSNDPLRNEPGAPNEEARGQGGRPSGPAEQGAAASPVGADGGRTTSGVADARTDADATRALPDADAVRQYADAAVIAGPLGAYPAPSSALTDGGTTVGARGLPSEYARAAAAQQSAADGALGAGWSAAASGGQGGVPPAGPPPAAAQQPPLASPRRGAWIEIAIALVGVIAIAVVFGTRLWDTVWPRPWEENEAVPTAVEPWLDGEQQLSESHSLDGIDAIELQVDAAELRIETGGESGAAELWVDASALEGSASGYWWISSETDALVLGYETSSGNGDGDWQVPGATLRLPASADGLRLSGEIGSGVLSVEHDFAGVELSLRSGGLDFRGAAEALQLDVATGVANVEASNVGTAELSLGSGLLRATIDNDRQPERVVLDVRSGVADLRLPEGAYQVSGEALAGTRTIEVLQDAAATAQLEVTVSSGVASVRQ